jgi:hypothetical protein
MLFAQVKSISATLTEIMVKLKGARKAELLLFEQNFVVVPDMQQMQRLDWFFQGL